MDLDVASMAPPPGLTVAYEPPVQLFGGPNAFFNEMMLVFRLAWPTVCNIYYNTFYLKD
jgi:hypothetical protein